MSKLSWDTSFRRAFKRHTRNNPALQDRIFQIVFAFEPDPDTGKDMIVLIDLGTHDEVY